MTRVRARTLASLLMLSLLPSVAGAEDGRLTRAQALFDEGRELVTRGDYRAACARFARSLDIQPGLGTRYHLADCWERIGRLASAYTFFQTVAVEASARGQRDRERLARARARALEPRLLRLVIEASDQPGLVVRKNDSVVAPTEFGAALPIDPGPYRIEAKLPSGERWSLRVEIAPSDAETVVTVPELGAGPS